ncbi:hypothetical protein SAMN05216558_5544 [Pseudomonas vancouverensis]|nr:hypothetical protein SAMN05216558_5544 [Pseudomonas vancouverensis]
MLAMDVNDNAGSLMPRVVLLTIASMLAPTEGWGFQSTNRSVINLSWLSGLKR